MLLKQLPLLFRRLFATRCSLVFVALFFFSVYYIYYVYINNQWKPGRLENLALQLRISNEQKNASLSSDYISVTNRFLTLNVTKNIFVSNYSNGYRFETGQTPFIGCKVSSCRIIKGDENHVTFSGRDFDAFLINVHKQRTRWKLANRRPDQMFIMFSLEPPAHVADMSLFSNYFNWTMTYRSDSDFVIPYGDTIPLESAPVSEEESRILMKNYSEINPSRGKTKLAVWSVSNCKAESNRQGYVELLSKFIPIDIVSSTKCGGKNSISLCSRSSRSSCYDTIEKTYKFYFAFENAICKDYVTEKFFDIFHRNIVLVVLGGADYSSIAPRHSYINALDYTPHQLADYLKLLDKDDKLYADYFWWKPYYRIIQQKERIKKSFCDLCEALHTQPLKSSTLNNAKEWFIDEAYCVNHPEFS
jgi:hypothetical protein